MLKKRDRSELVLEFLKGFCTDLIEGEGVRIMQSKSCRYGDEDINCREPYGRASSLLYRGAHKPR